MTSVVTVRVGLVRSVSDKIIMTLMRDTNEFCCVSLIVRGTNDKKPQV